jgi:hypothetical protein
MVCLICPKCSRDFVKRVSRNGKLEQFLSFFYIYPFRCQLCGFRFRFLQWGIRYQRIQEDRREYERLPVSFPVAVRGESIYSEGTVEEVSLGGCTVTLENQLSAGDLCTIALYLAQDILPIRINAAVVRSVRSKSLGVEFLRFQDNDRERLQLFIRRLLTGNPGMLPSSRTGAGAQAGGTPQPSIHPRPVEL